ncbi:MAG: hypothetical protein IPJ79_20755 [Bacteroidetes bacterium]|nr:hypothetical protein [Bacteroidota bacterium]
MSNLKHLLKLFALTCISLISFETAKSANHTVTYPLINNPPGTIVTVGTPTATGTVEALPLSGNFIDYQLKNYLTLSIQPEFNSTEPFELEVDVEITPYNTLNIPLTGLINTQTLKVIYHPYSVALDFSNINTILLQGTHVKFVYEIKAIRKGALGGPLTPISGGELLDNVMVEGKIESNRVYNFNPAPTCNITSINSVDLDCDASSNPDEYEVVWSCSNTSLVEEYQLEWTWTNNYPIPGQPFLTAANVSYNFANCSRVTVGRLTNSYKVSNIYESGFLVFRVRAVGRDMNNPTTIVNGNWNLTNSSGYVANATNSWVLVPEHENNINWQVSTTFAEEGKKKEVVSYFDGSFKNRQAVTKTNTDNDAVVGQSIYDTYGRPAISVLPTPVVGPTICTTPDNTFNPIKYYRNFNRNGNGSPTQYNSSNFDLDGMGPCLSTVQPMNTNSGASKYYSSNNPEKDRQQSFVPEANGYPFSQVEYTPDNTGRIRRQGSVGENYQLEQNKKYTEYYYGQPNQIQLDRLFGSEVGDATHYKKNVIIDPNGQASVTYLNMEGKLLLPR